MELLKLKHLECYIATFELNYRNFEWLPQRHQLTTTFHFTIEEVFETLDTEDLDMSTAHSIIDPIVNRNFGSTFHHKNLPNQRQCVYKNKTQKYQPRS